MLEICSLNYCTTPTVRPVHQNYRNMLKNALQEYSEKDAQRRCCKNCDRRSPVVYYFHYRVALRATNKVAKDYLCSSIYGHSARGRCRTCSPRAPSVGCRPYLAITAEKKLNGAGRRRDECHFLRPDPPVG